MLLIEFSNEMNYDDIVRNKSTSHISKAKKAKPWKGLTLLFSLERKLRNQKVGLKYINDCIYLIMGVNKS